MNIDHEKIRVQLERLAASPEFARTDRMARFLRFVVEKSTVGDTAALRERQIGIRSSTILSEAKPGVSEGN
jgi:hypothetical protein